MSQELTLFDYAKLPAESAELCRIVEIRIKTRTGMTIVENGQDLIKVKEALGHGEFGKWLASWFPMSESTAQKWMNVAREYKDKSVLSTVLGSKALCMLAAPSTPEPVRQEIERRAVEGGDTSVAEIARLKAEHKAQLDAKTKEAADSKAAADRAARDLAALEAKSKEKADAASRREANLISERNEIKQRLEEARADKARAIADKDEEKRVAAERAEKAAEEAWQEADEKYETIVNRLTREAKEAKEAAGKAVTEAEETAKALAEAKINEMMAQKQGELKRLQADSDRAASRATAAYEAEQRAKKSLEDYQKAKVELVSNDREIAQMVAFNASVLEFIGEKMAELSQFETDAPSDTYAKFSKSAQFCEQFAAALRAFIAPRIA